jgi:TldD protein
MDKVRKTALTAAAIARGKSSSRLPPPPAIGPGGEPPYRPASCPRRLPSRQDQLVREAYEAAKTHDPRIAKVKVHYSDSLKHMCVANSEGLLVRDTRPMVKLVCVAISEKDGKRESGYWGGGGRVGLEYFRESLTPR